MSRVRLIAEPWDIGHGGYRLGGFPPPFAEWNDRFRDTMRRFWRGDDGVAAEFATRFRTQAESDRFRVAALLSGTVEPTPKQFFLATAHSLTLHSSEFIDAFIRDYLQRSPSDRLIRVIRVLSQPIQKINYVPNLIPNL